MIPQDIVNRILDTAQIVDVVGAYINALVAESRELL